MEIFELPNVEIDGVSFLGLFGFQGLFSLIIYTEGADLLSLPHSPSQSNQNVLQKKHNSLKPCLQLLQSSSVSVV